MPNKWDELARTDNTRRFKKKRRAHAPKNYFVERYNGRWMVIGARRKSNARHAAVVEFGRGNIKTFRLATKDERLNYLHQKNVKDIEIVDA